MEVAVKKSTLDPQDLKNVKDIGKIIKERLIGIGIATVDQLAHLNPETLAECKGFGIVSAEKLITNARHHLEGQVHTQLNQFNTRITPQNDFTLPEENSKEYTMESIQEEDVQIHRDPRIQVPREKEQISPSLEREEQI